MKTDTRLKNWISVNLPENCPNVCISFEREIADIQIKQFGAKPLYGFGNKKEDWLPIEIFITYGGILSPCQEHDWGICKKEDVAECTGNMAGFGMDQSQRIIIDYDKDFDWTLVRRYRKKDGTS